MKSVSFFDRKKLPRVRFLNILRTPINGLAGPRQSGKTTLAKSLLTPNGTYLNWDVTEDRKIIRNKIWDKKSSIVVMDELHKLPKWRNYLKGLADEFKNKPPLLITGSARLDSFRRAGDALTGRHYFYRMHPFDPFEIKMLFLQMKEAEIAERLMKSGGFPESFLNPSLAARLRNDRLELVVKEDLRDLSKISSLSGAMDLIELLRERVGKPINYDSLSQDLGCSPPTVKNWVMLLEQLYLIFLLRPYASSVRRQAFEKKRGFIFLIPQQPMTKHLGHS